MGCESFINNETSGGIGRAIIGGMIAGSAGAVIGSATAKKSIKSLNLVVYYCDIENPQFIFNILKPNIHVNHENKLKTIDFTQKVNASIKALINDKHGREEEN